MSSSAIPGLPSEKTVDMVEIIAEVIVGSHLFVVTLMVFNRLFVQFYVTKAYTNRSYIREFLVFLSWLGLVFHLVLDFGVLGKYVWMSNYAFLTPSQYEQFTKVGGLVVPVIDSFALFGYKIVLNLIFQDWINGMVLPKAYWVNIGSLWFNVISWIIFLILVPLQCTPLSAYWKENPYLGNTTSACSHLLAVTMTQYVLHVASDILVFTIPFLIIPKLRTLSLKKRFEAAMVFIIGLINVFSMLAILVMTVVWIRWPEKYTYAGRVARLLVGYSMTTTGLMIVCVAQVRVFMRYVSRNGTGSGGMDVSALVELGCAEHGVDDKRAASSSSRSDAASRIDAAVQVDEKEKL